MRLRAICFHESPLWVAIGIERDIGAQGSSLAELRERFRMTVQAESACAKELGKRFEDIPPSPIEYERMWNEADPLTETRAEVAQVIVIFRELPAPAG